MSDTSSTRTLVPTSSSTTSHGDRLPSQQPTFYARCFDTYNGVTNDFPAFSTTPQQDHLPSHAGIRILPSTDRRAQPWQQLVRANVHALPLDKILATLPAREADAKQVRQWIYLLLTHEKFDVADETPGLVTLAVSRWKADGEQLRALAERGWPLNGGPVPMSWRSVFDERFLTTEEERGRVAGVLEEWVRPLLRKEEREREEKEREEREREARGRREKRKDNVRRGFKGVKKLLCFGGKAKEEKASRATDEKLPL